MTSPLIVSNLIYRRTFFYFVVFLFHLSKKKPNRRVGKRSSRKSFPFCIKLCNFLSVAVSQILLQKLIVLRVTYESNANSLGVPAKSEQNCFEEDPHKF